VISYRIKRMEEEGIIRGYRAIVDLHRLGYYTYRLYVKLQNIGPHGSGGVLASLSSLPNFLWGIETTGRWDLELLFVARNNAHFSAILSSVKQKLGRFMKESVVSSTMVNYHFGRRYLAGAKKEFDFVPLYGFEPEIELIGRKDFLILKFLSEHGDASLAEIGKACGLTYNGAKRHLESLEGRKIIQSYRLWLDYKKLGRQYYKALLSMDGMDEKLEKKMISFCENEPSVQYIVVCSGGWDAELEAEVESEEEFRGILLRFRDAFSDSLRDFEILHAYNELKMDYFPFQSYEDFRLKIKGLEKEGNNRY